MVELVDTFLNAVDRNEPVDVKAAKLVMIMTQSLYVRKELVLEKKDYNAELPSASSSQSAVINTNPDSNTNDDTIVNVNDINWNTVNKNNWFPFHECQGCKKYNCGCTEWVCCVNCRKYYCEQCGMLCVTIFVYV